MTAVNVDSSRQGRITQQMLCDLRSRIAGVETFETADGWACVLSGAGWSTPYRGATLYRAVDAAHSAYYWPQD